MPAKPSLLNMAWVLFDDPDPNTVVHRVDLATGKLVCAAWVTHSGGFRVSDADAKKYGPRCDTCWPAEN